MKNTLLCCLGTIKESTNTPEHKKKCSDRAKAMWADPVKKQKMLQLRKEFGKKLNRFSDEQEVEIVKRRGEGEAVKEIADFFNCKESSIYNILYKNKELYKRLKVLPLPPSRKLTLYYSVEQRDSLEESHKNNFVVNN